MIHLLSMTASEASCERSFSAMGNIQSRHRTRLGIEKLHKIHTVRLGLQRNHALLGMTSTRARRALAGNHAQSTRDSNINVSVPSPALSSRPLVDRSGDVDADPTDFATIAEQLIRASHNADMDESNDDPLTQEDLLTWAPSDPVRLPSLDFIPPNARALAAEYKRAQPKYLLSQIFNYSGVTTSNGVRVGLDFFWKGAYNNTLAEEAALELAAANDTNEMAGMAEGGVSFGA